MKRITLFDKSVDIHAPHHYETFGGKRHRVYGRRLAPTHTEASRHRALASGSYRSSSQVSGAVIVPLDKSSLPIFFYAFAATHHALGLLEPGDRVDQGLLETALRDIYSCCQFGGRPFFMGEHATRDVQELRKAQQSGEREEIYNALRELAETFHKTIEYLFSGGSVQVNWE